MSLWWYCGRFGTRRMLMGGLYPVALGVGGIAGALAAEGGADRFALCFVVFGLLEALTLMLLLRVRIAGAGQIAPKPAE